MSTNRMQELREKSRKRKELLQHTLGVKNLSEALGADTAEAVEMKKPKPVETKRDSESSEDSKETQKHQEFRDSTAFLKG